MLLFPAIDLYEGRAVRLLKGDYAQMTVYSDAPCEVARAFAQAGAEYAHIVDLEGARCGGTPNFDVIKRIIAESGLKAQVGGGVRTRDTIENYLNAGAWRVILGTAALESERFLRDMAREFGAGIAVGADVRDGRVAVSGWTQTSATTLDEFAARVADAGVSTLIVTDISRDGAMRGANRELYARLAQDCALNVVASGGVNDIGDLIALKELGLYGAIVGKAYYTGKIDLAKALELLA